MYISEFLPHQQFIRRLINLINLNAAEFKNLEYLLVLAFFTFLITIQTEKILKRTNKVSRIDLNFLLKTIDLNRVE